MSGYFAVSAPEKMASVTSSRENGFHHLIRVDISFLWRSNDFGSWEMKK
jgi:hypothetical protein